MATQFQPPPTYADPVLVDQITKRAQFNPLWLKWFLDLVQRLQKAVLSVTMPGEFGTVTSNGDVVVSWATEAAGTVMSGPLSGAAAVPTFKKLGVAVAKDADQSLASTTALTDDSKLTFAVAAHETWIGRAWLDLGGALTTTGVKVALTAPAAAAGSLLADLSTNFGASVPGGTQRTTAFGTALDFTAANCGTATDGLIELVFRVVNGANAGQVTVQFAQSTSSVTALTSRAGSQLEANRLA